MNHRWIHRLATLGAFAVAVVAARGSVAAPSSMLDPADPRALEVKALHDDISLANLLRGLSLTGEQLDTLAAAAARADELRAEHETLADPLLAEMETSFAGLRAELLGGGEPAGATEQRALAAQRAMQDQRREFERGLADLEIRIRGVLDEGQVRIIEDFKPCLIPPRELGEPARVGQSDTGGKAREVLGELRTLPPNTYTRRLDRFVDQGLEIVELRTGPLADEARQEIRERLVALAEEVRALDDVTWAIEGQGMAVRLKQIVEGSGDPRPSVSGAELTRVGRLLLAPGAADVISALASS